MYQYDRAADEPDILLSLLELFSSPCLATAGSKCLIVFASVMFYNNPSKLFESFTVLQYLVCSGFPVLLYIVSYGRCSVPTGFDLSFLFVSCRGSTVSLAMRCLSLNLCNNLGEKKEEYSYCTPIL